MDLFQAIILGLVEGVTEFLPISSTGHLIVISDWLSMDRTETQTAFEIIIQLAAILAVIANYGGKFTPSHIGLWQKIGLAFIPIGAVGFLFGDAVEALFSVPVVATAFIAGGIVLLVVERLYKAEHAHVTCVEDLSWRQAAWIGVAQVFALVPGTSRAGATIVGALLVGLDRKASAEFSFLLALPVMTATTGYELIKHYQDFTDGGLVVLGAGFVTAFIVARVTMRWFIRFLASFTFVAFGVYRILLGLALLTWFT